MVDSKEIIMEVGTDEVKGALCSSFLGRTKVEKTESALIEDGNAASAVAKLLSGFPQDAAVTLLLPGHLFMVRKVSLPFADRKKIRKTLSHEMEGLLPFPVDELFIDSVPSVPAGKGSCLMATAIPRKLLLHYLNLFPEGRKPSRAIPDFISLVALGREIRGEKGIYGVIEIGEGKGSMAFLSNGSPVMIRSITFDGDPSSLTGEVQACIKTVLKEGQRVSKLYVTGTGAQESRPLLDKIARTSPLHLTVKNVSFEDRPSWVYVAGGVLATAGYPSLNILGLDYESERVERVLKSVSIGAAILLAAVTGDLSLRYRANLMRYSSLKSESRKTFLSVMPKVTKVVSEDVQLKDAMKKERGALEELSGKAAPSYLTALNGIEKIIGEHPELTVREVFSDGYGLTIAGDGSGIEADAVKKVFSGIEGSTGAQVEEMLQGADPGSYRFRVKAELSKEKS